MRKILPADTLTPILAYMRVQGEHKVILESIPREKENARFSIVAYNPVFEVTFKDGVLYENGKAIDQDPFEYLDRVTVKGIKSDLPFDTLHIFMRSRYVDADCTNLVVPDFACKPCFLQSLLNGCRAVFYPIGVCDKFSVKVRAGRVCVLRYYETLYMGGCSAVGTVRLFHV